MNRRLPVYILIDTSGSMRGEPIESVKVGLSDMVSMLRNDPYALETVCISIITFDKDVKQLVPLTELDDLQLPDIIVPESGPTHTGAALKMLCERYDAEVNKGSKDCKGDWMPLMFLLTDGKAADKEEYRKSCALVKQHAFTNVVACAAGPKSDPEPLKLLTDKVFSLDTMDSTSFKKFFEWVTINVQQGGKSMGAAGSVDLPGLPSEINQVI